MEIFKCVPDGGCVEREARNAFMTMALSTQVDDERKALEAEAEKLNDQVADADEDEQEQSIKDSNHCMSDWMN